MSGLLSSYWVQFARTGNPNHPDLPVWDAYTGPDGAVMVFSDTPKTESRFLQERMRYHIDRGVAFLNQVKSKVVERSTLE